MLRSLCANKEEVKSRFWIARGCIGSMQTCTTKHFECTKKFVFFFFWQILWLWCNNFFILTTCDHLLKSNFFSILLEYNLLTLTYCSYTVNADMSSIIWLTFVVLLCPLQFKLEPQNQPSRGGMRRRPWMPRHRLKTLLFLQRGGWWIQTVWKSQNCMKFLLSMIFHGQCYPVRSPEPRPNLLMDKK